MGIAATERARVPLTMKISRGVVGPNRAPNWTHGKGKAVNIPLLSMYPVTKGVFLTLRDRSTRFASWVKPDKLVKNLNDEKLVKWR